MSLEQIVSALTNPDNAVRGQAEQAFLEATAQPDLLLPELLNVMSHSALPSVKSMAAILFRRYSFEDERVLWNKCTPLVQEQIKVVLLRALSEEKERAVRQSIVHAVSSTGKFVEGNWPQLLPYMFESCNSPSELVRESALEIFSDLPTIFGDSLPKYIGVLKEVFQRSLVDPFSKVKLAALKATVSFLLVIEDPQQRNLFSDLLGNMLQIIATALNEGDEGAARDAIEAFIDLAETSPNFLRRSLESLVPAMCQIINTTTLEDGTRHLALELLVTLSERNPGMIRKSQRFVETVYPAAWSLMVDLEDDSDWHTTNNIEDDETDSNPVVGEQAIDRIACALGGKSVLPYAFTVLPNMLQNQDWKYRHAALMTISAIGEGCHAVMEKQLDQILAAITALVKDPHPRVRYALCNALGQMSSDFAPTMQSKFHQVVLPFLLIAMEDRGNPRVQAHAAAALVNFSEEANKQILLPYLDSILSKLLLLIRAPEKQYVLEQAITTLATVADSAEDRFVQYYDTFVPVLIDLLGKVSGKEYRLLRGKTIECVSLIGLAVGKEKFFRDAKNVMEILLSSQSSEIEPDDPQISYILSSCARIGAVLGDDFIPYLPVVMPPLLRSATLKPDLAVIGPDDQDNFDPSEGWEFITLDNQRIGIKTSNLEEKCTAVEMLYCYAKELKAGFHQYAAQVLEIVVPLLKFYFDFGVRVAAASTIAPLLNSLKLANYDPQYIRGLWLVALDQLLEVIKSEVDPDIACKLVEGFHTAIEILGPNSLDQPHMAKYVEAIESQISQAFSRSKERRDRRQEEDYDEEVEELLQEEHGNDEYTLKEISDSLYEVFKSHREAFVPFFEPLLPYVKEFLQPTYTPSERQWALCIVDDVIEFAGEHSWKYQEFFLPALLHSITDISAEVRQAAAYGVGVCGKFGGPNYATACAEFVPRLLQVISTPGARDDENITATENAISAIAKVIEFNSSKFDGNALIETWLSFLPVLVDVDEAAHCYDFLCRLIESQNANIFGRNNANLPKIFAVFAEVIATEVFDDDHPLVARMINLLKSIEAQIAPDLRAILWKDVPEEYRARLVR